MIPKAAWKVTLDGKDLTDTLAPLLISLSLSEKRTDAADQLEIVIEDRDGAVALPKRGVTLHVALGWAQGDGLPLGLVDKGEFKVDEVKHSGPPDQIRICARSADFTDAFRVRRQRGYVGQTLGHILGEIASGNGLTAVVDPLLAAKVIPALGHGCKSDAALLAALGRHFDAISTVKNGKLLFGPIGSGKTPAGTPLPAETVDRSQAGPHEYSSADRGQYNGCEARWHDKDDGTQKTVTAGGDGGAGKPKRLRRTYHTEADARQAAEAENGRMGRGKAKMSFPLPYGRPDLFPGRPLTLTGWTKPEITGPQWLIEQISHTMDGTGGLISKLDLEAN